MEIYPWSSVDQIGIANERYKSRLLPQAFEVDSGSDLVPGFEIAEVSNATLPIRSVCYFAIFRPLGA